MENKLKEVQKQKIEKNVKSSKNEIELLNQFYVTIEATFERLNNNIVKESNESVIDIEIKKILNEPKSWLNIYKVEHLLVDLYDDTFISFEIKRRMLEIDRNLFKEHILFYKAEITNLNTLIEKRNFLSRLINDLQWRYTVRETKFEFQRKARKISSTMLFVAIVLFMIILFMKLLGHNLNDMMHLDIIKMKSFYIMFEVAAAGMFGSSLSIATSINKNIDLLSFDDLKLTHRLNYILSRISIGIGAAIIMYYFIQSGILTGTSISTTSELEYKLIILGFIAGFSEKLIPSVMSKTEKNLLTENTTNEDNKK